MSATVRAGSGRRGDRWKALHAIYGTGYDLLYTLAQKELSIKYGFLYVLQCVRVA